MSGPPADPVRTVFLGSGGFALSILEALRAAESIELVGVVSVPDRPVGRRGELTPTPVAARARTLGLRLLQPAQIRAASALEAVADLRPELGVLADFGRIVPAALLELTSYGILNLHPSLLPRHRGASPIPAAILAGDARTGVTIIRMDAGLDTGPIVAATAWPLDGTETAPVLEARAAVEGARLLLATLPGWLSGATIAVPQDEVLATLTRPLRREDGRLDPARPAVELERLVRAYQPWPGTFLDTTAGTLKVLRAASLPTAGGARAAGELIGDPGLRLATSDGDLALLEVQPPGGRPMDGDALLRGRPGFGASRVVGPGSIADAPAG